MEISRRFIHQAAIGDEVMRRIAALLPVECRGPYALVGEAEAEGIPT